ncbi:MAG: hypothetical protein H0T92_24075 [Pyrinomonadaceae bacterium]|nr:hypothetical protein [Pyrinomonadaceae bacterium]
MRVARITNGKVAAGASALEDERVAKRRQALELAETQGVAGACRIAGISRACFYKWKARYEPTRPSESLKSRPPVHRHPRQLKSPSVVEKVLKASRSHPDWGCVEIAKAVNSGVKDEQERVSSPTVQKILLRHGLGSRYERRLKFEDELWGRKHPRHSSLDGKLVTTLMKNNPCFRHWKERPARPGTLLTLDTFTAGILEDVGRIFVHALVDTFSCYAFAKIHESAQAQERGLLQEALLYFTDVSLGVLEVRTLKNSKYSHTVDIADVLRSHDIVHTTGTRINGFAERFRRTARVEFFRKAIKESSHQRIEILQSDFAWWLERYNKSRSQHGFPNHGHPPLEIIKNHLAARKL